MCCTMFVGCAPQYQPLSDSLSFFRTCSIRDPANLIPTFRLSKRYPSEPCSPRISLIVSVRYMSNSCKRSFCPSSGAGSGYESSTYSTTRSIRFSRIWYFLREVFISIFLWMLGTQNGVLHPQPGRGIFPLYSDRHFSGSKKQTWSANLLHTHNP
jgi:hypothetical protein